MRYTTESSAEATVEPAAIWRAWADVERWPEWNGDIERIELRAPFATGATIAMTPKGAPTVELRVTDAVADERFVDEAEVAGTTIRTLHRIDRLGPGRVRIVYALEADGPAANELGPAISADFDETIASLIGYAGR